MLSPDAPNVDGELFDAVKARAAEIKRQQEAHAAAMAQYEAQKAKYEADLAKYQALCKSSKRYRCPGI